MSFVVFTKGLDYLLLIVFWDILSLSFKPVVEITWNKKNLNTLDLHVFLESTWIGLASFLWYS